MAAMNEEDFRELLDGIKEVGMTENGTMQPNREFAIEGQFTPHLTNEKTFAICLSSEDEALIPLKIYQVTLQPRHNTCTVKDENNETTACPIDWFLPIEFPSRIERLIQETELALA